VAFPSICKFRFQLTRSRAVHIVSLHGNTSSEIDHRSVFDLGLLLYRITDHLGASIASASDKTQGRRLAGFRIAIAAVNKWFRQMI
jgi:hypothetical protein